MAKWTILFLFIFSISLFEPGLAHARARHSRPSFHFRFPLPLRYSKPAEPAPTYSRPIYQHKESPLPRIYTLDKPLVDDPRIYRPLIITGERYVPASFYHYDREKNEYATASVLHADAKVGKIDRLLSTEVNGETFYYDEGLFYKKDGKHLIIVPPAINSIVQRIPEENANFVGDNYKYKGIYYKQVPGGYRVVGVPA